MNFANTIKIIIYFFNWTYQINLYKSSTVFLHSGASRKTVTLSYLVS